jgi:DNA helicase-2/ATP-dependent DNA helicase PcrA
VSLLVRHDPLLDDLNDAQRAAVTHGEGPLLVLAGAGTGKTRVLTRRIAWLIATRKAAPSEILGLTFTDKAAQEIEERVDRLVPFGYTDMTLVTFHALGRKLLNEFGMLLGLPKEPRVLTEAEVVVFLRERLFALPLRRLRPLGDPTKHLQELVQHFGRLADEDVSPEAYAAFAEQELADAAGDAARLDRAELWAELAACYRAYLDLLASQGVVDFAGLLTLSLRLLREHPAVASELRRRHPWILVDEFQDTNYVQFELVRTLAGERPNLTVVGDDDQSIYKFRGASISNILDFRAIYPACATHVLVENYRSTQPILDAAYKLVRHNDPERLEVRAHVDKRLVARGAKPTGPDVHAQGFDSPSTEADFVAAQIRLAVDEGRRSYGDFAVLLRRHAAADPVVRALNLKGIPCRVAGGGGLYDRPEVIASLDALAAMSDPTDDRALFFLAASEIYGVPPLAITELRRGAERKNRRLLAAIEDALALGSFDAATQASLQRLLADLAEMRPFALRHPTGETLYRYLALSGYLERLTTAGAEGDPEADLKVQNLAKLFAVTRGFGGLAVRDRPIEFTRHLALLRQAGEDPRAAEPLEEADAVHVLTVHRAKGLEFPVVFLVGLEANHFPAVRRPDPLPFPEALLHQPVPAGDFHRAEERRLFYVGMTRAREELTLTWAVDHGGPRRWKASPFVLEALDQARVDAPLARAATEDQIHRHMKAPDPVPLALAPIAPVEDLELSNRQVDDWLTCPLRYKYAHVLRVPLLPHHSVGYGLALHNAIRDYYVHAREGWPVTADRLVEVFEESWTGEGFITREHELQRLARGREAIAAWYERERAHPSSPAVVEGAFRFRRGANVLRGRFDRVDRRPEGAVIVDFKSSAVDQQAKADARAKDSLQLKVYALAWRETEGAAPAAGELHFIESGLVGRAVVDDKALAKAEAAIDEAAQGIRAREFGAKPDWITCRYCAYHAICPSRATDESAT